METIFLLSAALSFGAVGLISSCQAVPSDSSGKARGADPYSAGHGPAPKRLFLDIHHMGPGKVDCHAVAGAHAKDLAVQDKHGVDFIRYWVDEAGGNVYCLSTSTDAQSIRDTHAEAHGLLPDEVFSVTTGREASPSGATSYFLDVHELGQGKVSADDVAAAHAKDLAVQKKYGVNFINYWFDAKSGRVVCLSQAPDSDAILMAHKEAHGLIPENIVKVKPGE